MKSPSNTPLCLELLVGVVSGAEPLVGLQPLPLLLPDPCADPLAGKRIMPKPGVLPLPLSVPLALPLPHCQFLNPEPKPVPEPEPEAPVPLPVPNLDEISLVPAKEPP